MRKLIFTIFLIKSSISMAQKSTEQMQFVYVMDPMCSWCYGFSPEIEKFKAKYESDDRFTFRMVAGGLNPGNTKVSDEKMKKFLKKHWEVINKRTGQPFKYDVLTWENYVYDTENPDRAIVAMNNLDSTKTFKFIKDLQLAFYSENKDITKMEVIAKVAEKHGIDSTAFHNELSKKGMRDETWKDFRFARWLGATGFPALYLKKGEVYHTITYGYTEYKNLEKVLERVLRD